MKELYEVETLRKVARWFYDEQLTKKQIRARLRLETGEAINPRTVTKILNEAHARGIVRIDYPSVPQSPLEDQIRERFPHLQRVIAVPDEDDYGDLLAAWGKQAAKYFEQLVSEGTRQGPLHVGISGGETLLAFANAVPERLHQHVHIHTTALIGRGETGPEDSHIDPLVTAQILWSRCGRIPGHCHYATVPPYDGLSRDEIAAELRDLSQRKPIRAAIENMDRITVAFAGLGLVKPGTRKPEKRSQLSMTGLLQPLVTPDQLVKEGALGDLAYCLFDNNGEGKKSWEFFITAGYCDRERKGVEFYKQMVRDQKKVIAIAGTFKEPAISRALYAKLFNVWITDETTARGIVEMR